MDIVARRIEEPRWTGRTAKSSPARRQTARALQSGVFNENEVRAAAGLTMVVGAVAFAYAYFDKNYVPLQVVATFFFVEFLIRVTLGLQLQPDRRRARAS